MRLFDEEVIHPFITKQRFWSVFINCRSCFDECDNTRLTSTRRDTQDLHGKMKHGFNLEITEPRVSPPPPLIHARVHMRILVQTRSANRLKRAWLSRCVSLIQVLINPTRVALKAGRGKIELRL